MGIPRRYTITRHALYDLVWSTQLEKVAAKLGIREAELVSLCLKQNVPRPWSGYWRLKVLGKPAEPKPLLEPDNDSEFEIRPQVISVGDPMLRREVAKEMIRIRESKLFTVANDLRNCHTLVFRSQHLLSGELLGDHGMISPPKGSLAIKVSKGNILRSLLLMDAILKGFEELGYEIGIEGSWPHRTFVEVMGVEVLFGIREYWLMEEEDNFRSAFPRFQLVPAGRLRLEVDYDHSSRGGLRIDNLHRQFDDTKTKPLEVRLKAFALGVVDLAARSKEALARAEERSRERARQEMEARNREQAEMRQREAKLAKIRKEQERVAGLIDESERWAKSNRLRDYIKAKMARSETLGKDVGPDSAAGKWWKWALEQADRLDPLKKSLASILDTADID